MAAFSQTNPTKNNYLEGNSKAQWTFSHELKLELIHHVILISHLAFGWERNSAQQNGKVGGRIPSFLDLLYIWVTF